MFAANYLWPERTHDRGAAGDGRTHRSGRRNPNGAMRQRTGTRATSACCPTNASADTFVWEQDFPRTASLKIKRGHAGRRDWPARWIAAPCSPCERAHSWLSSIQPRAEGAAGNWPRRRSKSCARAGWICRWRRRRRPGDATRLARAAYAAGQRQFHRRRRRWHGLRNRERPFPGSGALEASRRWAFCRWERATRSFAISAARRGTRAGSDSGAAAQPERRACA